MDKLRLFAATTLVAMMLMSCNNQADHHKMHGTHPALYATLYQQRAAEYKALCYQAYNIANLRLDASLKDTFEKPLAIVVDIDETVLDNSPYQAKAIMEHFGYPVQWKEWIESASAETVPGAVAFLNAASEKGVKVFYITNRKEMYREATLKNLIDKGFPNAVNEYLLMRTEGNDKEGRREIVREEYHITLLMGDNLGDFSSLFDTDNADARLLEVEQHVLDFGNKWIVLPNPVYGSWMNALPGYDQASTSQDDQYLEKGLIGF